MMLKIRNLTSFLIKTGRHVNESLGRLYKMNEQNASNVLKNDAKFYCTKNQDEQSAYDDENETQRPKKRKPLISDGVKLYPGFQESVEKIRQKKLFNVQEEETDGKHAVSL
jgi:hypothetical protein